METVVARHRRRKRRTRRITIDVDVTEDPTHGAQQGSFFNSFYDGWCYLPLVVTLTFDDEPRQYVVAAILRPGNASTAVGVRGLLRRLIRVLSRTFPRVRVRMDAGFATPEIFEDLDQPGSSTSSLWPKNAVLTRFADADLATLRPLVAHDQETRARFGDATYQTGRWARPRRVIFKPKSSGTPGASPS